MSDNRLDAFAVLLDQLRGRRHALQLAAIGLITTHFSSAPRLVEAKKKKHKRKKKHKKPKLTLAERCVATCANNCEACMVIISGSLICADSLLVTETPCTSNSDCADPAYPYCTRGDVNRADGVFTECLDGEEGCCANVGVPCG